MDSAVLVSKESLAKVFLGSVSIHERDDGDEYGDQEVVVVVAAVIPAVVTARHVQKRCENPKLCVLLCDDAVSQNWYRSPLDRLRGLWYCSMG